VALQSGAGPGVEGREGPTLKEQYSTCWSSRKKKGSVVVIDASKDANEEEEEEEDAVDDEEEDDEEYNGKKPASSRALLEVKSLQDLLAKHCHCPECDGPVQSTVKTICLASSVSLVCCNDECGYIFYSEPPAGTRLQDSDKRQRMSDYAVNMLYVLGFLACGNGGTEAGRLLGVLGLPNDTTMEKRSFGIIEDTMAPFIKELKFVRRWSNLMALIYGSNHCTDHLSWIRSTTQGSEYPLIWLGNKGTVAIDMPVHQDMLCLLVATLKNPLLFRSRARHVPIVSPWQRSTVRSFHPWNMMNATRTMKGPQVRWSH
jgi:hypothetical protein